MTRTARILVGGAAAAVIAGTGIGVAASGRSEVPEVGPRLPPATEPVERGDLSESTQADGTLNYAQERKLNAGATGMTTWIARPGSTVRRDQRLYAVNGVPVRLMYGSEPMYRTLRSGDSGEDVRQVEENLAALGYRGFTVDDEYTDLTATAVKSWQEDHDRPRTGVLGPEQIAFAPGPARVEQAETAVSDLIGPGQPVLTTTDTQRVVTFDLEVSEIGLARKGTKVRVTLPDGKRAAGRVFSVARTATTDDEPDPTAKVTVTVKFDRPDRVTGPDQSPVTVDLVGRTRKQVLSVPVGALLALPGGGFGVEVVSDGTVREVEVELGLFADGRVEVTGEGLREGLHVGMPKL